MKGNTFVIGDIHGCQQPLSSLLAKVGPFSASDTVVFLGDYIDRGPNSREVVSTILELQKGPARIITLMGNHERMLLRALEGRERPLYLRCGGYQTLLSYEIIDAFDGPITLPPDHLAFFHRLLPYWEDREHIFVHAGLEPDVPLAMQNERWLLWARHEFTRSTYDFGKRVIYGHSPQPEPRIETNKIGLDTGAVYGGHLTCLILPAMECVSVEGHRHWPEAAGEFERTAK